MPPAFPLTLPKIMDSNDTCLHHIGLRRIKRHPSVVRIPLIIAFAVITKNHPGFQQNVRPAMLQQRFPRCLAHSHGINETTGPIRYNHLTRWSLQENPEAEEALVKTRNGTPMAKPIPAPAAGIAVGAPGNGMFVPVKVVATQAPRHERSRYVRR